jgi:hypothetical protein
VTPTTVVPLLTGPVAALVVLIWVVWMLRQDIKDMRRALEAERRRADSAEEAARASLTVISALTGQSIPQPSRTYVVTGPGDGT